MQLQRFSVLLWNNAGRAEYFPHAMRALDALSNFSPETPLPELPEEPTPIAVEDKPTSSDNSTTQTSEPKDTVEPGAGTTVADGPAGTPNVPESSPDAVLGNGVEFEAPPVDPSFYYGPPEPFDEWVEPPPTRPPTTLQILLAEGAAIWISEATPVLRRYIEHKPLTDAEKTWFGCAQESRHEREGRWQTWRNGLEKVFAWCVDEKNGLSREATVLVGVACALQAMDRVERDYNQNGERQAQVMPRLGGQVCLPWCV